MNHAWRLSHWGTRACGILSGMLLAAAVHGSEAQPTTQGAIPIMPNQVPLGDIKGRFNRAIISPKASDEEMVAAGLRESTLAPAYPKDTRCYEIDHVFGEVWRGPADTRHTGADIPAPWDYPIHAMADGIVVAKFDGKGEGRKSRGIQLVLQHAPEEAGLPVWSYTLYSHFREVPRLEVGQRVRQGEYLGPNGKTGVPGPKREPHLHLTAYISASPRYAVTDSVVVPEDGVFIDPVALFRGKLPMDTQSMQSLPEDQKKVVIAFRNEKGDVVPAGARIIWPMNCR